MDRRRRKTRAAIFGAFEELLSEKPYSAITVGDIIKRADVGRTTFYDNFETKDDLLRELCEGLFGHISAAASDLTHEHGLMGDERTPSVFLHLLEHLKEDDGRILRLLASDSGGIFARYFTESVEDLVSTKVSREWAQNAGVSFDFLVHQVSAGFVSLVQWWVREGCQTSLKDLNRWFLEMNKEML